MRVGPQQSAIARTTRTARRTKVFDLSSCVVVAFYCTTLLYTASAIYQTSLSSTSLP